MQTEDHNPPGSHLVQLLVLEAGRLMEDASPLFAQMLPVDASDRTARLRLLFDHVKAIEVLVHAAVNTDGLAI